MRIYTPLLLAVVLFLSVGCSRNTDLTYSKDIAPIIYNNCTSCHRDEGTAPFSLTTYQQVNRKKNTILDIIQSGLMPPWPADINYSHFVGERHLSDHDIQLITEWVNNGAPEGDTTNLPMLPSYASQHSMGQPDTTIWLDSIHVKGDSRDQFHAATIPIHLSSKRHVRAITFTPKDKKLVHQVSGRLSNGMTHTALQYLPSYHTQVYPKDIGGFSVDRKFILTADIIHYGPSSKDQWDHSKIKIYYTDSPPKRPIHETIVGTHGTDNIEPPLIIPPNTITKHVSTLTVHQDISVLTITPQMHLLGKTFLAYAITPSQDTIRLINIPKWDFRWQYFYTFPQMLKIPSESTIHIVAEYDNTSQNPNNPNSPPTAVRQHQNGEKGIHPERELLQLIINWLPYHEGDEDISLKVD